MVAHERVLGTAATEAMAGSALRLLRRLSPVSSMRWALWTRQPRMASAHIRTDITISGQALLLRFLASFMPVRG
jgi:hypothetical protein